MNRMTFASTLARCAGVVLALLPLPGVAYAGGCEQHAKDTGHYIPVEELGDWEPIDDRTLLIWIPDTPRAHLVHLSRPLPTLRDAEGLTVVEHGEDRIILPCGRDAVEIDDDPTTSTSIADIEPLSEAGAVELLHRIRSEIAM